MHIYHKYTAGDIKGALEAQYKLNPVRLAMSGCQGKPWKSHCAGGSSCGYTVSSA